MCYRCFKAAVTCICASIAPVNNRTPVTILQHTRERNRAIGTARFATLGLRRVRLVVHGPKDGPAPALSPLPPGMALLYPNDSASADVPAEPPSQLLVLDGTWHHARRLFFSDPALATMPRFSFGVSSGGEPQSRYRIRREPAAHCMSTVEAIVRALKLLEPDTDGLDALLNAFDAMVSKQERYVARQQLRRRGARPS